MPFFVSFLFLTLFFFFFLFAILPLLSSFPFLSLPSPAYKVASCLGAMLPCSRTLSYPAEVPSNTLKSPNFENVTGGSTDQPTRQVLESRACNKKNIGDGKH